MATSDATSPELRRFSIGLPRPLWIGSAAAVLFSVGIALQIGLPIYRQEAAIRAIDRMYGIVGTEQRGPDWLRSLVGDERMRIFDVVESIEIAPTLDSENIDAELANIAPLSSVRKLSLGPVEDWTNLRGPWFGRLDAIGPEGPSFSDAGMSHLKGMKEMQILDLSFSRVTDTGLAYIKDMLELTDLNIGGTQATDASLSQLVRKPHLARLVLYRTRITDAGLVYVGRCASLESLDLRETSVTDSGLSELRRLPRLKAIALGGTQISDCGLKYLEECSTLERIDLTDVNITDAGLQYLHRLPNLCEVVVTGARTTQHGRKLLLESHRGNGISIWTQH